jgi:hypothetical protein
MSNQAQDLVESIEVSKSIINRMTKSIDNPNRELSIDCYTSQISIELYRIGVLQRQILRLLHSAELRAQAGGVM